MEIKPSYPEFKRMAAQGNLIPVYGDFLCDTETPVSAYLKIKEKSFSYLLESADRDKKWGRYSFIGYKPYLTALSHNRSMELVKGKERKVLKDIRDPMDVLRKLTKQFKPVIMHDLHPFQGGMVGYFNYDLVRKWEYLPALSPEDPTVPESILTISRRLIIFDHFTHKSKVVVFVHLENHDHLKEAYDLACQEVHETVHELGKPLPCIPEGDPLSLSDLESNLSKDAFEEAVRKAKEYIVAGDIIQVVISQRFSGDIKGEDFALYRKLRSINPSPYMFYLNFGDIKFIGASPEILVRLTDGKIELRPIAGTRPRGNSRAEDEALATELLADEKERAEHIMLVDLGRNDVGRVCEYGTVGLKESFVIERYSHVMHIASHIQGKLQPGRNAFDLLRATFPAGTVSGAPKVRAMEIIEELEGTRRGPYAGAILYMGYNGSLDSCITIRTIWMKGNTVYIQSGGGVVADSDPATEEAETRHKARAVLSAIATAEGLREVR